VKNLGLVVTSATLLLGACTRSDAEGRMIQIKGSNTMLEVGQAWAETYSKLHPDVRLSVNGGGSSIGVSSIIDGTVDFANCSRKMDATEIDKARKNGHEPVEHHVGYDGIAIFVHKDNPVASITMDQLKQIYIDKGTISKWSQLGVKLPAGASDEIVVASRDAASGTFEYFREDVLGGKTANFRNEKREMTSPTEIIDLVSKTKNAIGYSGLASARADVRAVPIARKDGDQPVMPSIDTVLDKTYPISRPLFMYSIGEVKGPAKDYLDWILSDAGQRVLLENHYPPLRKL
jgi:phosphate transport system substrate-binding protein